MDKIRISFTGDILSYECQNKLAKIGPDRYDYMDYLLGSKPIFEKSNYVVGSLETPIAGGWQNIPAKIPILIHLMIYYWH